MFTAAAHLLCLAAALALPGWELTPPVAVSSASFGTAAVMGSAGNRFIVGASYAWLRWSSGSIATVSTMHAALNESMTRWSSAVVATSPAAMAYTTTETGFVTALVTIVLACYLLTRRTAVFREGARQSRVALGLPTGDAVHHSA